MILNLLGQETDREPMRSLMARAREAERRPGLLSVSLMAGFPYADVPEMGPSVIAVADGDRDRGRRTSPTSWPGGCGRPAASCSSPARVRKRRCARALASDEVPVVLVDLGDNIGGGSAGDGTVLLAELLRQRAIGAVVVLSRPGGGARPPAGRCRAARFEAAVGGAGRSASRRAGRGPRRGRSRCTTGSGSRTNPGTAAAGTTTRGRPPSSTSTGGTRWC